MSERLTSRRVLVTGSSGTVGGAVVRELLHVGHRVRGFDCVAAPAELNLTDAHIGDLSDAKAVLAAAEGMDTILHLAAYPNEADFIEKLLAPNVIGVYNICEAARIQGVRRLVLVSTVQTVWKLGADHKQIRLCDGTAPVNHYALTKVYAEHMGAMYAREHGLSVLSIRLGWVPRPGEATKTFGEQAWARAIYLSPRDAGRAFACAVQSPRPSPGSSAIIFLSSRHVPDMGMDPHPAKEVIGFEAMDEWPEGATE